MRVLSQVPFFSKIEIENPKAKALIFDMDGTLFDTEVLHALALKKLLDRIGRKVDSSIEEIGERYRGLSDTLVYRELIDRELFKGEISLEEFLHEKNKIIFEEIKQIKLENVFDDKLLELINRARSNGYKIALCTASERDITDHLLKIFNFHQYFDLVKTDEDFIESKPSPIPYIETIKELGLEPKDVVIFEDSEAGIKAAKFSGAPMYKVTWY